jgi:steroid 5-alpha reductase family enzyme
MSYYITLVAILFVFINVWFVVGLLRKRNDVADIAWGLGFVLLTWSGLLLSGNYEERQLLVTGLVTLWGFRLAWHIGSRNNKKAEDYRYQAWRRKWGKWFLLRSYGQVYLLQALLLFIIILPVLYLQQESYSRLDRSTVWMVGFLFEAVGDLQLRRFIKDTSNKGKILTTGLWRYTRHPNYFGEVTLWWGMWIIVGSVTGAYWILVSPLLITYLILKVSGIPMLEKRYEGNAEFDAYKEKTSAFFPWFAKEM